MPISQMPPRISRATSRSPPVALRPRLFLTLRSQSSVACAPLWAIMAAIRAVLYGCWSERMQTLPFHLGSAKRSEEHTSELQSLMRLSYAVFCLTHKRRLPISELHLSTTQILH